MLKRMKYRYLAHFQPFQASVLQGCGCKVDEGTAIETSLIPHICLTERKSQTLLVDVDLIAKWESSAAAQSNRSEFLKRETQSEYVPNLDTQIYE